MPAPPRKQRPLPSSPRLLQPQALLSYLLGPARLLFDQRPHSSPQRAAALCQLPVLHHHHHLFLPLLLSRVWIRHSLRSHLLRLQLRPVHRLWSHLRQAVQHLAPLPSVPETLRVIVPCGVTMTSVLITMTNRLRPESLVNIGSSCRMAPHHRMVSNETSSPSMAVFQALQSKPTGKVQSHHTITLS